MAAVSLMGCQISGSDFSARAAEANFNRQQAVLNVKNDAVIADINAASQLSVARIAIKVANAHAQINRIGEQYESFEAKVNSQPTINPLGGSLQQDYFQPESTYPSDNSNTLVCVGSQVPQSIQMISDSGHVATVYACQDSTH